MLWSGVTANSYYQKIIVGHEDSRIPIMESIAKEIAKDSLRAYVGKLDP